MSESSGIPSAASPAASRSRTSYLASMAMLCALAYLVMWLSKTIFAPIRVAGLLTFDLKDTVIAIGGFIYGPFSALILSVVTSLIEMVSHSDTGPVGLLMNVLSTCAFVCPAAWIYQRRRHSLSGAVMGLGVGSIFMAAIMLLWNYLITPLYQHVPREVVAGMLLPVFLPFNLVKALMNSALTMVLYKPVVTALRKARLAPEGRPGQNGKAVTKAGVTIVGLVVLVSGVLLALVLAEKI